jgi:hypothetical protein
MRWWAVDIERRTDQVCTAQTRDGSPRAAKSASALHRRKRSKLLLTVQLWHRPAGVEQSKNIPPRYAVRLDDLRPWHVIVATCRACGKRAHVNAAILRRGRPAYTRLLDLERKLRCSSCGNRQGNSLTVSMAPRN